MTSNTTIPSWDLSDLYKDINDNNIQADIQKAIKLAKEFQAKYQNKLININSQELTQALTELESLREIGDRPYIFAMLLFSADSDTPAHGALMSKVQEEHTEIQKYLTFFSLEWNSLPQEKAQELLKDPVINKYKHFLEDSRKYKNYQLSEKEEILWQNLDLVGNTAWSRLFDEVLSKLEFTITMPGEESKKVSEEEVLALLYHEDRAVRKMASDSLTAGLKSQEHVLTYIFNIILQDKAISDNTRGYEHAKKSRNLSNEIEDASVENLISSTESQQEIVTRFYNLKKKLLGLDTMYDYDRYAPISLKETKKWSWEEASKFVKDAYNEFSPQAGSIVQEFYDKKWIDADLRDGKRGGAFSASTLADLHPYILMNFTGTSRDVATLAHELGHGIHQLLSQSVGYLNSDTPLTTAETASVFGEMLIFEKMLQDSDSKEEKLGLIINKLDDIFATVFRQVCMTRFEEKIHTARREQGELKTEDLNKLWIEANSQMFGDNIKWTDNYNFWWSYIPHFIHSPFYCYAYAFGLLLSITLYFKYKQSENKQDFVEKYTKILSLGGSLNPVELLKILDIDLNDKEFWNNGFKLVDELVSQAEELI